MCEHPLKVFGEVVPSYFVALAIGFALATFVAARGAKRMNLDPNPMIDLGLFSVILGVIGARLMHVVADGYFWDYVHMCTDPSKVAWPIPEAQCLAEGGTWDANVSGCRPAEADCFAWARFWSGGLTYYGGFIVVVPFALWFLRWSRFPIGKACDLAGIAIPIGLVCGRIGCFLAGCCYGRVTDSVLGVSFPPWSAASRGQWREHEIPEPHLASLPVHPTQLYEAAGCLGLAVALAWFALPRKRFDGQVLILFVIGYGILRFAIEFLRADDRGELLFLSTSQTLSLLAIASASFAWWWKTRPH